MTENEFRSICEKKIVRIKECIKGRKIYIWGAGVGGKIVKDVCCSYGITVSGFCDKNADAKSKYLGYSVYPLDDMSPKEHYLIISLMTFQYDLLSQLYDMGYTCNDCFYINENEGCHKEDIIYRGCKIGRYTYGYKELLSYYPIASSIGRYCSINSTARIWNNHPTNYVTTHPILDCPLFYSWDRDEVRRNYIKQYGTHFHNAAYEDSPLRDNREVIIGNDVWIGANTVILPGVRIGDGAIIAAGAVVTKDVEPYAIMGGVPAKTIKYRFTKEKIDLLELAKWWEWPVEKIEKNIELFYQPECFFEVLKHGMNLSSERKEEY